MTSTTWGLPCLYHLKALTDIHVGMGQTTGAVDLPVQRERHTGFPIIRGASAKGAFRQFAVDRNEADWAKILFGETIETADSGSPQAGALIISDIRLLFLPVRNCEDVFSLVTCPMLLKRYYADQKRLRLTEEIDVEWLQIASDFDALATTDKTRLYLEERVLKAGKLNGEKEKPLKAILEAFGAEAEINRVAIVKDELFAWFCDFALPVHARNSLDEAKTSQALWYEETLPPMTFMYGMFAQRFPRATTPNEWTDFFSQLKQSCIQIGGNESIGQGWFEITEGKTPAVSDDVAKPNGKAED